MKLEDVKTPEDILKFMDDNIQYGWIDVNGEKHIGNMKNFRRLYRTMSLEETLKYGMGTCVEQVYLMKYLLDNLGIKNKMFCTRIYEGRDFNNLEEEEHMHCFLLYYIGDKVFQIEHPNWERVGIYEYESEEDAISKINQIYIEMAEGKARPVTEYSEVPVGISFKELNCYINDLDKKIVK